MSTSDLLQDDEMGIFYQAASQMIEDVVAEGLTVFVVQADTQEDHDREINLHKKAVILPYETYLELTTSDE